MSQSKSSESEPTELEFHFTKSAAFRVVHYDGAIGGPAPNGNIVVTIYSERMPVPKTTIHPLTVTGKLGPEIMERRETKSGVVREMEVALVMTAQNATQLSDWLLGAVASLNAAVEASKAGKGGP